MLPVVTVDHVDATAWIRLNRPDNLNAMSHELLDALDGAASQVANDPAVRVVVVTGAGSAFCVGADLKGLLGDGSIDPAAILAFVKKAGATLDRIAAIPKPVIAAVNGLALAGGIELVLCCDVVVAATSARLGDAHANYGLLPGAGGAARLSRVVGPTVAKYLALTGTFMTATQLQAAGLVNEVVDDRDLAARAQELANLLAAKSTSGLAEMKRLIDEGLDQPLSTALALEHEALARHAASPDFIEGLTAFSEKRAPHFA